MGLQEGYSQEQWGPWKSHGLLLQQAIAELGWQESAAQLIKLFKEEAKSREGYLSRDEFVAFMQRYPCCNAAYRSIFFDLFDRNQDGYLSEADFLGGILAVSPSTPHKLDSPSGQLRMQFIFLYYDANRNGRLEVEEIAKMLEHIQQLRGQPQPDTVVDATTLVSMYSGPLGFAAFFDAAKKRLLNGTSPLLRTPEDVLEVVRQRRTPALGHSGAPPPGSPPRLPPHQSPSGLPSKPSPASGYAAVAAAEVASSVAAASQQVPSLPLTTAAAAAAAMATGAPASASMLNGSALPKQQGPPPYQPAAAAAAPVDWRFGGGGGGGGGGSSHASCPGSGAGISGTVAQHDRQSSNVQALALRVVRRLMELSSQSRSEWRYTLQLVTAKELLLLCDTVVEVLRREGSLVEVPLPCRVYGDIHGQLLDLLEFFNAFSWPDKRRGDIFSMNYVFLGDFVDRGAYSCDVVCLLFSLKILYPSRIYLVRGNHEDRLMNINYGFHADCMRKFAHEGEDVWERVNDVFEFLPISALVDGAILCIHGGIGDTISSIDDLRGIPKPIQVAAEIDANTTRQDRMVLDALWSDPTDNDQVLGVHSSPRGKNTCRFGPDRVQDFNRRNGLRLIIRAHECVQHGYEYFAAGQLLTVFSATNYCNQHGNDGAMVVLVRDDRTGEVVEHAQVIKSGTVDTSYGWNDQQFRAPSPMRRAPGGGASELLVES